MRYLQNFLRHVGLGTCVFCKLGCELHHISQFLTFDKTFEDKIFEIKQKTLNCLGIGALKIFRL